DRHIDVIRALGNSARTLMVLGHNPTLHDLALVLAGSGADRDAVKEGFPTGAVAVIDFATARWTNMEPGEGELTAFLKPRQLR
ncbi:histidine phosphatase family protein, partial [Mycobacterium tuberculosis]|nr:histidine phosphatase family protein [Mycobacterium tuberculosis]